MAIELLKKSPPCAPEERLWTAVINQAYSDLSNKHEMERYYSECLFNSASAWRAHLAFICDMAGFNVDYVLRKYREGSVKELTFDARKVKGGYIG